MKKLTKSEARKAYRQAWFMRCLAQTQDQQVAAERVMDAMQPHCVESRGPGPEWDRFIKTLPGFIEFWNRWSRMMVRP